jgi:hypothetical protein
VNSSLAPLHVYPSGRPDCKTKGDLRRRHSRVLSSERLEWPRERVCKRRQEQRQKRIDDLAAAFGNLKREPIPAHCCESRVFSNCSLGRFRCLSRVTLMTHAWRGVGVSFGVRRSYRLQAMAPQMRRSSMEWQQGSVDPVLRSAEHEPILYRQIRVTPVPDKIRLEIWLNPSRSRRLLRRRHR